MNDPLWYRDAIFYELRVRAFFDSDGDGIGDLRGLTQKLGYIRDLGADTLWVLPFYPSPLKDDGYDISDYSNVHPDVGTLRDFRRFIREAHACGLRVVTELVLNHTSDQHPWFQRARKAKPGSRWRDFYVWSEDPERYADARIIFKDFEPSNWTWDREAHAYYWHRFYANQPDLNFENPAVRRAVLGVLDFWLDMGIDGLRLDAVPYLYEREGTNCENLPETHAFLKMLRAHVDRRYTGRMLLAEANQWPEDAVAYFGDGDECHMAFHFPIMPRMFMALHMEDRFPIVDILHQTPQIPDACQWALFLRNHDELTLEMVTDEERDYMYRVYAHDRQARINLGIRRRLAPLLGNDRRRIELMNALLFSLPGTPVIYYGDEIGMGDNIYLGDRNGVRTPMQWSADRNAGFSRANPQRLYLPVVVDPEYHYETMNVEAQERNPHSLLWWTRRLIALRKRFRAFGRGTLEFLQPRNRKVLAFLRHYGDEHILVVANLSRYVQYVELDLSKFRGQHAVELFGGTSFPPIGDLPYLLTLGPHAFYWFALEPAREEALRAPEGEALPELVAQGSWRALLDGAGTDAWRSALTAHLVRRRWFGGKARRIKRVAVEEVVPLRDDAADAALVLVGVDYTEGAPERYVLPLAFVTGVRAVEVENHHPHTVVARVTVRGSDGTEEGIVFDALGSAPVASALLDGIERRRRWKGRDGTVVAARTRSFASLTSGDGDLRPTLPSWEQSNTSAIFGDRLVLKLYRRAADGVNPDLELGRFLSERARFEYTPRVAGFLEYRGASGEPATLAVLQELVRNEGDAWRFTLEEVERYFEEALAHRDDAAPRRGPETGLLDLAAQDPPEPLATLMGGYIANARLLGRRTAELHRALASGTDDPALAPEPFSKLYQRALYQSMRNLSARVFRTLADELSSLPAVVAARAEHVLAAEAHILERFRAISERRLSAVRIRCHGDYHLGQALWTGKDFVILDFEGEPARPLGERRIKRPPLVDVAGMLRSFHYASATVMATRVLGRMVPEDQAHAVEPWAVAWRNWATAAFLGTYLSEAAPVLPPSRDELGLLLDVFLLEKAIYELGYELNNRPAWAWIPIEGVLELLEMERVKS